MFDDLEMLHSAELQKSAKRRSLPPLFKSVEQNSQNYTAAPRGRLGALSGYSIGSLSMTTAIQPTLSRSEWSAVSIALQDAQRCGCAAEAGSKEAGLLSRAATFAFGRRRPTPLADTRLEAVRRFVCASNRRRRPADDLAAPLAAHGFSPAQIDALGLLAR